MIDDNDKDAVRYNLFETHAPGHTKNYMTGLDVLVWKNKDGTQRSQLIVDQKAGSLVLLWEPADGGGIWMYLQETYRAPHSKDSRPVAELLAQATYDELGVWSLEAPAGGLNYVAGRPAEAPEAAAVREVAEETGLILDQTKLHDLLPGGLQIAGDVSTKRTYLFAANLSDGRYDAGARAVESDEAIGRLIAFRIASLSNIRQLTELTRRCSGTTPAVALAALQPPINQFLV